MKLQAGDEHAIEADAPLSEPAEYVLALRRGIRILLILLGVYAVFGRAYSELLPKFADAVCGYEVEGFAWLTSATGAGSVAASIVLASRGAADC